MTTISSTPTLAVPTSTDKLDVVQAGSVKAADRALNSLLKDPGLLEALSQISSTYVPPSGGRVLSLLWSMMNEKGGGFIDKNGVEKAILAHGGGSGSIDALWKQLNPENKSVLSAADFATSDYLRNAVGSNLTTIQEDVNLKRLQVAANEGATSMMDFLHGGADNVLSGFSGGTGTVLDLFS